MRCQSFTTGYVCTNASGTTCTKKLVNIALLSTPAPCNFSNGDVAVLEQADVTAIATLQSSDTTQGAAITSLNASAADVTTLKGQMTLIQAGTTLQASPTVRSDVMQAEGIVFGVTLAAAATIWGVKQLFRLFKGEPNGD